MSNDWERRMGLAYINLCLMKGDLESALRKLSSEDKPVEFQAGMMIGLTAAKHVLDGLTADEAWQQLEPVVNAMREADE